MELSSPLLEIVPAKILKHLADVAWCSVAAIDEHGRSALLWCAGPNLMQYA